MQELSFVGLTEDGTALTLSLGDGRRFRLPIDERVRAATRGAGRAGQLQMPTESMRPREMQARVRAGATPEEIAESSGWDLQRVEAFAVPVLQERSFMAQQAAASLVHGGRAEVPLSELVAARLAEHGVDPLDLRWDAWRRDDNQWVVLLAYPGGQGDRVATWLFDSESRTLEPQDDEAVALMAVSGDPEVAMDPEPVEDTVGAQVVTLKSASDSGGSRHPVMRRAAAADSSAPSADEPDSDQESEGSASSADRSGSPSAKRASVPSWDEILFGSETPAE